MQIDFFFRFLFSKIDKIDCDEHNSWWFERSGLCLEEKRIE